MPFFSASKNSRAELEDRVHARKNLRTFGISFLDEALIGIGPGDLVLLGAPPGIGKTQLCCNIAKANIDQGRRVHFIALESDEFEIERRLKYEIVAKLFYSSSTRPELPGRLSFDRWRMGDFIEYMPGIELEALEIFENQFKPLILHYKAEEKFGIDELIRSVISTASETDLFIIDHAHYFDLEDEGDENHAMKKLAKTVRHLAIDEQRPIILVAHLRKRDRHNNELVPDMDEFHGSSDLAKIATRVITLSSGSVTPDGHYETFFRVSKNRLNGGSKYYVARLLFNPQKGCYEQRYRLGKSGLTRVDGFQDIEEAAVPEWARSVETPPMGSGDSFLHPTKRPTQNKIRQARVQNVRQYPSDNEV